MIDLEKLYAYKNEYELEKASLEKKLVYVNAKLEVVSDMIADEEKATVEETAPLEENTEVVDESF